MLYFQRVLRASAKVAAYNTTLVAWMEFSIGGAKQRVEYELFGKVCPVAVENFAKLCTGESVLPEAPAREALADKSFKDRSTGSPM